jgi:hypothetical protein
MNCDHACATANKPLVPNRKLRSAVARGTVAALAWPPRT